MEQKTIRVMGSGWFSRSVSRRGLLCAVLLLFPVLAWGQDLQIGGKIAFTSNRDGNYEIYTMNPDGTNQVNLTNNSASDYAPSWSSDGTKIAFFSNRDGNYEIYAMNADGTNQTRLTNNTAADLAPCWSPDGTKIAFGSNREGYGAIFVMNADGTGLTQLTNDSLGEGNASWSPDGSKIAFVSNRNGYSIYAEIYVMNADGTNQTRLTNNTVSDEPPTWSPDGSKMVFHSFSLGSSISNVYVMNADGTGRTQLTNNSADSPSWSPDGTRIAFNSTRDGNYEIYVMNADGTGQTRLTNNSAEDSGTFSWAEAFRRIGSTTVNSSTSRTMTIQNTGSATLNVSNITSSDGQFTINPTNFSVAAGGSQNVTVTFTPTSAGTKYSTLTITSNDLDAPTAKLTVNGTATAAPVPVFSFSAGSLANSKIAFQTTRDGNQEIYTMNPDGTNQTSLTNNPADDAWARWSPDGARVVFHSTRDGNYEIYTMSADGTNPIRLTNNSAKDMLPSWSPDGTKIVFTSDRDGNDEVYVMGSDGTGQTRLTNDSAIDSSPAWSSDGTKIAFYSTRVGSNPEIYLMNSDGTNQTRLTSSGANSGPSWSPDGTKIAFETGRHGTDEIYVINADGTNEARITNNAAMDDSPWWSPDGTKIAFKSDRDGYTEIYTMNADGTGQTLLTSTNDTAGNTYPSWSPFLRTLNLGTVTKGSSGTTTFTVTNRGNGTLSVSGISVSGTDAAQFSASPTSFNLATGASQTVTVTFAPLSTGAKSASLSIAHNAGGSPATVSLSGTGTAPDLQISGKIVFRADRDGNNEIYTMNADGTSPTRLTNNSASDEDPSWSSDAAKIVFLSNRDGNKEIYVMNADGTGQTRLTNNSVYDAEPSYSPDGTKVAFGSDRDGNNEIYVMNADGTGQTRLTNNSAYDANPSYSPDGTKIAFGSTRDGNWEIYAMNADGSNPTRLTSNSVGDLYPSWSPDGAKITYRSYGSGDNNSEIYVMNADGSGQINLTNHPAADDTPSWSPDGTKIVFSTNRHGSRGEVYVMNADGSGQIRLTDNSTDDFLPSWGGSFRRIGSANVGSPVSRTMTIENKGNGTLNVSNITSNDGQFSISPTSFSVAPGSSQNVTVTFTPTSAGVKYSTLTISSNDADAPTAKLTVNGTGQEITPIFSPSATSVSVSSAVTKGSSGTTTFTVTNSGGGTLSVSNITSNNSQFTASPTSFNLSGGASQTVTVTFAPTKVGWEQGALTIAHNAAGNPATVTVSGIGRVNPAMGSLSNTKIAFTSERDGAGQIYAMNTDGTNQTRLTNNSALEQWPSWSPDGSKIVFVSTLDNSNGEIYTITADGTNRVRLTNNSVEEGHPTWSPDGTKIAFLSARDGNQEIYAMNTDGSSQTRLTNNSASDANPSWSPDGTKIVFYSNRDGNLEIYVMNADGTNQIRLTNNTAADLYPFWSPDGTKIAFTSDRDGNNEIYVMNADGTNQIRLTNNPAVEGAPAWSPDGTKVIFVSERDGNFEIYTMNADGTNPTRLTNNSAYDSLPSWSPFITPAPSLTLSATALPFGSVEKNQSAQQTFKIKNTGNAVLSVTSLSTSAPFAVSPSGALSINAGDSTTVTITFSPTAIGAKVDTVRVTHNAAGSPSKVALSGTGVDTTPPTTPAGLAATAGNAQVSLLWTANAETDLSHYVIYRSTTNNFTPTSADSIARASKPTTTFTSIGLGAGTYYFKLAAVDSAGNKSSFSAQATATLAPIVSLSFTSVSVGNVNVGSSGQSTFTVGNTGNAALSVTGITVGGTDAGQFSASPTSFTVNAGGTAQTVTVTFTPSGSGTKSGLLSISHNASGNPSAVILSGTGQDVTAPAPPASLAASAGNAQVVLTWTANTETDLSHYVLYRSTTTNFTPTSADSIARVNKPATSYTNTGLGAGTYYFKLAAVDSAGNKSSFSAQASAAITVLVKTGDPTPSSLTFKGSASSALAVAVSDSGNTSLTVTPTITGPDAAQFSVSPNAATTVLPGAAQSFTVTFNPSPATGNNRTATLNLAHNATNKTSPLNVSLIGDVPPNAPAGLTVVPGNSQATLSWTANSESDLSYYVVYRLTNTSAQGDSVGRVNQPATSFTHTGLSAGIYYYKLKAVDTGGNKSGESNPVQAIIAGEGSSIPVPSPNPLVFGNVKVGQSKAMTLTVSNASLTAISVSGIGSNDPAFAVSPASLSLPASGKATATVTFTPTDRNAHNATLTLTYATATGTATLTTSLTGQGTPPETASIDLRPSALNLGNVKVDSARVGIVRVRNAGGDTLKVAELKGLQPPFSATSPQGSTLLAGDSTLVRVRFAPTARGAFADTLVINSNGGTRELALSGRGTRAELSAPERLVFDPVLLGGTGELNLILTNVGDDTLQVTNILSGKPQRFQVGSTRLVIPPNNAQGVSVRFTPTTAGKDSTELTLSTTVGIKAVRVVGNTTVVGVVTLSPDTLWLGPAAIGTTATGSVELRNDQGDTLRVSQLTVSPAVFKLARSTSRLRVAPGAVAQISLTFKPVATDTVLGALQVRSDAPGSPHRVVLIGLPEPPPRIALSPADTLRFGVVGPGQSQLIPLAIRNNGGGILKVVLRSESEEFVSQQTDTVRIGTSQQQNVQVRFQPARTGTRTANLQLWANDPQIPLSALVMQGIGGGLRFEPVSIDFGSVLVGTAKDTTVTLINETANALTLTLDLFGAGFSADPRAAIRIDAGKRVPVQVRFEPNAEGEYSAKLEVRDRNVFLELFGKGVEVKVRLPTGLAAARGSDRVTLTWNANTEAGLSYYVVYRSPQENFEPVATDSLGKTSRTVTRFTDRKLPVGTSYYRLVAVDRAGNRSQASEPVAVTMTSTLPTVAPDRLDFGQVAVGTLKTLSVVVTNPGTSALSLTSLTLTGRDAQQYAATSTLPLAVSAGSSATLSVVFNPTDSGAKTALLNIAHDRGAPLTVALSGIATAPAGGSLQVSPSSLSMDNTPAKTTSRKTLRLSNPGSSEVKVTLRLGGRNANQFKVTPSQATVRAGRAQSLIVTFAPTSAGTKSATLTITPSTGSPLIVALSGKATAATASGLSAPDGVAKPAVQIPGEVVLGANYPNPFNAQTLIHYQLAQAGPVRLAIYDMLGQQVVVLMNGVQGEGRYQVTWDGRDQRGKAVASGIYFYRIETGPFRAVRKLLLVR